MKTKALYALSADPIHFGHLDIIRRAARDFELTVLVATNPSKKYFFTAEERLRLVGLAIKQAVPDVDVHVTYANPGQLTADFAFQENIPVIVRGVRNIGDYDMEKMMRDVNVSQQAGIETYFLSSNPLLSHISSTAAKELFAHAGFIHQYVPLCVKAEMEKKSALFIIGVTGGIGAGKSWFCEELEKLDASILNLDMDTMAHGILFTSQLPAHKEVRRQIREKFPLHSKVMREDLTAPLDDFERKSLGELVFADGMKRSVLNDIMHQPILTAMRERIAGHKGIVLLNAALLAECGMTHICNHRVVLITAPADIRMERLKARGYSKKQIEHRLNAQLDDDDKKRRIEMAIKIDKFGKLITFENDAKKSIGGNELYKMLEKEFNL